MRFRPSLRLRVAAAFAGTTTLALLALGAYAYEQLERTLVDQTETSLRGQLDALDEVPAANRASATRGLSDEIYGQLFDRAGRLLATSPQVSGAMVESGDLADDPGDERLLERAVRLSEDDDLEMALLMLRTYDDQVLVVGTSEEDISDTLQAVLLKLLIGGPLLLLLASGTGYLVAGVALRPVERMRRRAARISDQDASDRLPLPGADDEIRRLGETLNAMLDRLEAALTRERRFVAEASHELRTPLALLRMELDLAMSRPRSNSELLEAIGSANDEVERLTRLSEDLLLLSEKTEYTQAQGTHMTDVDVTALMTAVAARFGTRAAATGREVRLLGTPHCVIQGDRDRLDRALSNLVDNALLHGDGDVELAAREEVERLVIEVTDHGTILAAQLGADPFQAFAANPEARGAGSRGLGLAIVRAIIEQHHGTVHLVACSGGAGTVATIVLPLDDRSSTPLQRPAT